MIIGTHDGQFHPDDVFSCATLQILYNSHIIRSRKSDILNACDILVDVGGTYDPDKKIYDHHYKNPIQRPNKIPYSSFGLIWKDYGLNCLKKIKKDFCKNTEDFNEENFQNIFNDIDQKLVLHIDEIDNGYKIPQDLSIEHVIYGLNHYREFESFYKAVKLAKTYLICLTLDKIQKIQNQKDFNAALQNPQSSHEDTVILKRFINIKDLQIPSHIHFLICPSDSKKDTYLFYCLSQNEKIQNAKYPFQKNYRGINEQTEDHEIFNIIKDLVFIHPNGFVGGTQSLESAKKLRNYTEIKPP